MKSNDTGLAFLPTPKKKALGTSNIIMTFISLFTKHFMNIIYLNNER